MHHKPDVQALLARSQRAYESGNILSELHILHAALQTAQAYNSDPVVTLEWIPNIKLRVAQLLLGLERVDEAVCAAEELLAWAIENKRAHIEQASLVLMGQIAINRSQPNIANQVWKSALSLARRRHDKTGQADLLRYIGLTECELGLVPKARLHLRRALSLYENSFAPKEQAMVLFDLGNLEAKRGRKTQALGLYEASRNLFDSLSCFSEAHRCLLAEKALT